MKQKGKKKAGEKNSDYKPYLTFICQLILGSTFIYASLDKIIHPDSFAQIVEGYQILPIPVVNIFAIVLPWLELFCGILLIAGIWSRTNAALFIGMLVMFIIAMSAAIVRGLEINCGCFEAISEADNVGWGRVIQDVGLLLLAFWVFYMPKTIFSLEPLLDVVKRKQE